MFESPPTIFISYSRIDSDFVDRLETHLLNSGFSTWVDRSMLARGHNWLNQIQDILDKCAIVLVVLSPEAAQSEYVLMEYRYAKSRGKLIIPLEYRPTQKIPIDLHDIHRIIFHNNYDRGLQDLLEDLDRNSSPASSAQPATTIQAAKHPNTGVVEGTASVLSGKRGADIEQAAEITLAEAYSGVTRTFMVRRLETCSACLGMGRERSKPCKRCQGKGQIIQTRRITANIPAGMETGIKHVMGEGHAGQEGGPEGDLLLFITVIPDSNFTRKGIDLYTTITIDKATAQEGGQAPVILPDDKQLLLTIPPQTPDGKEFRLSGKGMLVVHSNKRGHLYVKVRVNFI